MKGDKVTKRTLIECFLVAGAVVGAFSTILLVGAGTAPLMQKIEKMERKLEDNKREIEELKSERTEMELTLENKQNTIKELTEVKKVDEKPAIANAPHPDLYRGEYGFQYCPNWSWDPWYSWNCKKYYYDLKN